jgi:hypothetical protein
VVVEDIRCSDEALEWIKSLSQEEMPDAVEITEFIYHQVGFLSDVEFAFIEAFVVAAPTQDCSC